jgi:hypothetical protein
MTIEITFTDADVEKTRALVARMAERSIVLKRKQKNIERRDIVLSHQELWKTHVACLLTTQQKSGDQAPVMQFLQKNSPILSESQSANVSALAELAETELSAFGGIRRFKKIAKEITSNMDVLKSGGWKRLDEVLAPYLTAPQPREAERHCANVIAKLLNGFGPKQSRNFLQWLGLTRYEIPIDSRVIKWLRQLGKSNSLCLLSPAALSDHDYYCCVVDAIQDLCAKADVLPCLFDAAVFASFERT